MPGLVGVLTAMPAAAAKACVRRMVDAVRHEDFYGTGAWSDPTAGVYVGWCARKGSVGGAMSPSDETGNVVLVFAGAESPDLGAFPAGVNGPFHALLVDRADETAALFTDRYGLHRLHYHDAGDAFYFATEAKAILAVQPERRRLDARSLAEFVTGGCVLDDRTFFDGVRALPPAACWRFRRGVTVDRSAYFHAWEWERQDALPPVAYLRELRAAFAASLPRHFDGAEHVGMSLTGGVDTRLVIAWSRRPPGALPCYTFGSGIRESRDVQVARRVARACHQPHEVITVGDDFLRRFAHYAERVVYLAEGRVDVGRAADLYVSERARAVAPVRLTGNYGGEVLRGVRVFKPIGVPMDLFPEVVPYVCDVAKRHTGLGRGPALSAALFQQLRLQHAGLLALEESQVGVRSPFLDNDVVRTAFRAPARGVSHADLSSRWIAEVRPDLCGIPTDRGPLGGGIAAALARAAREASARAEYAFDYGMPPWLARVTHALAAPRLERVFLGRHKFAHFRTWYRDVLAGYLRDTLLDVRARSRPYLDGAGLERLVREHTSGTHNHTLVLHRVLTLELLHRVFFDGAEVRPVPPSPPWSD